MESAIRPAIYDESIADEVVRVSTEDAAIAAARRLSREEGLFVGPTSGAALLGCLAVARNWRRRPARIVAIFAAHGNEQLHPVEYRLNIWSHPPELNRRPTDYVNQSLYSTELGWLAFSCSNL